MRQALLASICTCDEASFTCYPTILLPMSMVKYTSESYVLVCHVLVAKNNCTLCDVEVLLL